MLSVRKRYSEKVRRRFVVARSAQYLNGGDEAIQSLTLAQNKVKDWIASSQKALLATTMHQVTTTLLHVTLIDENQHLILPDIFVMPLLFHPAIPAIARKQAMHQNWVRMTNIAKNNLLPCPTIAIARIFFPATKVILVAARIAFARLSQ